MINKNVIWTPTPDQARFLSCPADEALFGGQAGPGKSESLIPVAIGTPDQNFFNNPNWKALILSRNFTDLEKTLIPRSQFFLNGRAHYDGQKYRWKSSVGGIIQFGHMKNENDKYNYKSTEYNVIAFDELTRFLESMYMYMFSRNRSSDQKLKCIIRGATNPGGIGHNFVKQRFIQDEEGNPIEPNQIHTYKIKMPDHTFREMTRAFIPAQLKGNPHIFKNDPNYVARLAMLPEVERKALLEGNWDVYSGQFFTEFTEKHICEAFDFPQGWPVWISMDWGYATWCAVEFFTQDPSTEVVYLFDEIYVTEMAPQVVANIIKEKLGKRFTDVVGRYTDKRVNLKEEKQGGISTWQKFADEGVYFTIANDDRIPGWHRTRELLMKDSQGNLKFQVFDSCRKFIEKIPNMVHDERKPDDMEARGETHLGDALRYFSIMRRFDDRSSEREVMTYHPKTGYPMASRDTNLGIKRLTSMKAGVSYVFKSSQMGVERADL